MKKYNVSAGDEIWLEFGVPPFAPDLGMSSEVTDPVLKT